MYFQTDDSGLFVLDPVGVYDDSSFHTTPDGEVKLLLTNKKDLRKSLDHFFTSANATLDTKVGQYNCYTVQLNGPMVFKNIGGMPTDAPDITDIAPNGIYYLVRHVEYIQSKTYRDQLLADWVLQGANPSQFNRLLKRDFDMVVVDADKSIYKIVRKNEAISRDAVQPSSHISN